jgi:hypothetical protein
MQCVYRTLKISTQILKVYIAVIDSVIKEIMFDRTSSKIKRNRPWNVAAHDDDECYFRSRLNYTGYFVASADLLMMEYPIQTRSLNQLNVQFAVILLETLQLQLVA